MNVSAILVTRGDVDLEPVLASLPVEWEKVIWDNGAGEVRKAMTPSLQAHVVTGGLVPDLSVYGRYAAIEYASHNLIYVQDDDVIVSDPLAIVMRWWEARIVAADGCLWVPHMEEMARGEHVACNMPQEFRHDFYEDHALVGFGAAFHRDAPRRAIERFEDWYEPREGGGPSPFRVGDTFGDLDLLHRTCDVVFTGLTSRVLVDVPKENLPHAYADNRMWKQATHQGERERMLDLVRRVRDA